MIYIIYFFLILFYMSIFKYFKFFYCKEIICVVLKFFLFVIFKNNLKKYKLRVKEFDLIL